MTVKATTLEVTPQWQTYLNVKLDVEPYLQFRGVTPTQETETLLQLVTDMTCQWVQRYLGRPIAATRYFRYLSGGRGPNGAFLSLPYYPIIEVHKVVEWWGTSGAHVLNEQTPENQGTSEEYQVRPLSGILARTFQGLIPRPWFPGERNIEVEWTAGYEPIPADIRVGTLEAIHKWWVTTQDSYREGPAPGSAGYEYGPAGPLNDSLGGVMEMLKPILSPYVQQGLG